MYTDREKREALAWANNIVSSEPFEMEARLIKTLAACLRLAESELVEWKAAASGRTVSCVCGGGLSALRAENEALKASRDSYRTMWVEVSKTLDEVVRPRAEKAEAALAESRAECQEQARLNGMGGERELALRAEVARLQGFHESCAKLTERVEELISEVNESDANFTEADKENDTLRAEVASLDASEKKWRDAYHTEAEAAILLRAENEALRADDVTASTYRHLACKVRWEAAEAKNEALRRDR